MKIQNPLKSVLIVVIIAMLLPMVSCDATNPSALARHWLYESGNTDKKPQDMELFKDGTGVCDGASISWKVENKRFIILSSSLGMANDYEVSDYRLTLTNNGEKITYLDINNKNYQKSLQKGTLADSLIEQECIAELEESLSSFYSELDGCTEGGLLYGGERRDEKDCTTKKMGKQIEIMLSEKNCNSIMCIDDKCEPCTNGECPYDCKYKSKCFSYDYHNFDAGGYMSMKSNVPMKDCSAGNVWKIEFDPSIHLFYSVPENTDCKNITPKRVKDNTTLKSIWE